MKGQEVESFEEDDGDEQVCGDEADNGLHDDLYLLCLELRSAWRGDSLLAQHDMKASLLVGMSMMVVPIQNIEGLDSVAMNGELHALVQGNGKQDNIVPNLRSVFGLQIRHSSLVHAYISFALA
jgi:hypothetical protein